MPSSLADSSNTSAHAPMLRPATTDAVAGTAKSTLAAIPNVPFLVPQLRPMQPASAAAAHDAAALPGIRYTQVVVKPGDTLLSALARGGVSAADASRSLPKLGLDRPHRDAGANARRGHHHRVHRHAADTGRSLPKREALNTKFIHCV